MVETAEYYIEFHKELACNFLMCRKYHTLENHVDSSIVLPYVDIIHGLANNFLFFSGKLGDITISYKRDLETYTIQKLDYIIRGIVKQRFLIYEKNSSALYSEDLETGETELLCWLPFDCHINVDDSCVLLDVKRGNPATLKEFTVDPINERSKKEKDFPVIVIEQDFETYFEEIEDVQVLGFQELVIFNFDYNGDMVFESYRFDDCLTVGAVLIPPFNEISHAFSGFTAVDLKIRCIYVYCDRELTENEEKEIVDYLDLINSPEFKISFLKK